MSEKTEQKQVKKLLSLMKNIQEYSSFQQIIRCASKKLGDMYLQSKQIDLAEKLYLISNFIVPNDSESFANLAKFYYDQENIDKAFNFICKAVECSKNNVELLLNAGIISADCGKFDEALNFYQSVLKIDPDNNKAKFGLAVENFKKGNLLDAYKLFIHRHSAFKTDQTLALELTSIPKWDGKSEGKIVIYNEQGYGDFIFGLRYLNLIQNDFCFYIDNNINSLFKKTILESLNKRVLKKVKYRCSILDLPSLFEYKDFNSDTYQKIFKSYKKEKTKKTIGLIFSGGKGYSADKRRSIHLSKFKKLLENKDYEITLFQKNLKDNIYFDIELPDHVKICRCENFYATAQALRKMACVVSVDTSVAHLSGALGIPTFVLLDKFPDYRWWTADKSTPWYNSWTLCKQKIRGSWKEPVDQVCKHVKKLFNGHLLNYR